MILHANHVGVALDLEDFHALARRVAPDELEALGLHRRHVLNVDLVPVSMTLVEGREAAVEPAGVAVRAAEHGAARAQAHRATHVRLGALGHEDDDRVWRVSDHLCRVSGLVPQHIARELDHGHLEAKAHAEVRLLALARVFGGGDLALNPAVAEAAGDHDAVRLLNALPVRRVILSVGTIGAERLGLDPLDDELALDLAGRVVQRLGDGQVRVAEVRVLAHHRDGHRHVE